MAHGDGAVILPPLNTPREEHLAAAGFCASREPGTQRVLSHGLPVCPTLEWMGEETDPVSSAVSPSFSEEGMEVIEDAQLTPQIPWSPPYPEQAVKNMATSTEGSLAPTQRGNGEGSLGIS